MHSVSTTTSIRTNSSSTFSTDIMAKPIIAFDGEGRTLDGQHVYTLLAYSDCTGARSRFIERDTGLSSYDCLNFIVDSPAPESFAYGFRYDITMLLRDLPDDTLYSLLHPDTRLSARGRPIPVRWREFEIELFGTQFSVRRGRRQRVIWDVLKFYQSTFVDALASWSISDRLALIKMQEMKAERSNFSEHSPAEVRAYCLSECRNLATLVAKLRRAHDDVGLHLENYYGAGSTATLLLRRYGIDERNRATPPDMERAIAQSFSGGRFEANVLGRVPGPVYSADINSAYPYHAWQCPCLDCGTWRLTDDRRDMERATAALVEYSYDGDPLQPWAPFFYRDKGGAICYPSAIGSGWAWRPEYLAGERGWSGVTFRRAWIYESSCDHRPFADIPRAYLQRLALDRENPGAGKVVKLAINAVYGKLAQSVGRPKFQCWTWASMITSGTRADILDAIAAHRDRNNLLFVATDGIFTKEKLELRKPLDSGTDGPKPLGGWLGEEYGDMFSVRPGIYFSTDTAIKMRGRGIGRKALEAHKRQIADAYEQGRADYTLTVNRFFGAKSCLHASADGISRSPRYGQWGEVDITLTFDPWPKRRLRSDGTLALRCERGNESYPYAGAMDASPESAFAQVMADIEAEQPA